MLKVGDVVFGKFACKDGSVLRHYSVVLQAENGGLLLAYTTSMKESAHRANPENRFSAEDMKLANFDKPCLWDASTVSIVPDSVVRYCGRVTKATLSAMQTAYRRAQNSRAMSLAMLSAQGSVITA